MKNLFKTILLLTVTAFVPCSFAATITAEEVEKVAFENEEIIKFTDGKEVVKKIYVPERIYTIVIK